jgi:hypothetical protein
VTEAGSLAAVLAQGAASASVPTALQVSTVQAATLGALDPAAAGVISAKVATLTRGVLQAMFWTKLKITGAVLLALAILGTGLGVVSYRTLAVPLDQAQRRETPTPADTERQRDVRKAADFQGKITALSEDRKVLTLQSRRRGEEPKKIEVKLTDKTKIEFVGVLRELGLKLKVGDGATVWLQEGSKDRVALVQAQREPDLAGTITAVSPQGKSLTLEVPSRDRREGPAKIDIKLTDKTKLAFPARRSAGPLGPGEDEDPKLKVDDLASVWLQEGSKDTAAAIQTTPPRPDVSGTIAALSKDGKVLTLASKGRSGEVTKTEIKLTDKTRIVFAGAEKAKDRKLQAGDGATIWLQKGSRDTAALVQALTAVQVMMQQRSPDVTGTITALSKDGKVLTLESRKRGEAEATTIKIKIADKTQIVFAGTEKEEQKLTVGYSARVWLQEGSKDTAAVVQATKPAARPR